MYKKPVEHFKKLVFNCSNKKVFEFIPRNHIHLFILTQKVVEVLILYLQLLLFIYHKYTFIDPSWFFFSL